jgi:Fe-S oxidoreductase
VAMGISCRQQIAHGAGRRAVHVAELLAQRARGFREDPRTSPA